VSTPLRMSKSAIGNIRSFAIRLMEEVLDRFSEIEADGAEKVVERMGWPTIRGG